MCIGYGYEVDAPPVICPEVEAVSAMFVMDVMLFEPCSSKSEVGAKVIAGVEIPRVFLVADARAKIYYPSEWQGGSLAS